MAKALNVVVKESVKELKSIQKMKPSYYSRIQMLLLIKEGKFITKDSLAEALQVSTQSVHIWRTKYNAGGIDKLLEDKRGGKPAQITDEIFETLSERLNNNKEGFKSFIEIQQWLQENFGIEMKYQALNKFIKRKFGARPKVARKSHINKDENAAALFKKTTQGAQTY
jgi:transposase